MEKYRIGTIKYSDEYIRDEANKYASRRDFKKNSPGAYNAAVGRKILDEIAAHLPRGNTKFTKDIVREEAAKYSSKAEFAFYSKGAYGAANRMGIMHEISHHMVSSKCSLPQKICKQIFDALLNSNGVLDELTMIKPFHIDIYYPSHNFGIEYDGYWWHKDDNLIAVERRKRKLASIRKNNLTILFLKETNGVGGNYEKYVKNLIIDNLSTINALLNSTILENDILDVKIDYNTIYITKNLEDAYGYNSMDELQINDRALYMYCKKNDDEYKKLQIFYKRISKDRRVSKNKINREKIIEDTKDYINKNCKSHTDFSSNKELVKICRTYNIMDFVKEKFNIATNFPSKHKVRKNIKVLKEYIVNMSDEEFIQYCIEHFESYALLMKDFIVMSNMRLRKLDKTIKHQFNNGHDKRGKWTGYSDTELLQKLQTYKTSTNSDVRKQLAGIYDVCYRRKLLSN